MDTFTARGRGHHLVSATSGADLRLVSGAAVRPADTDAVGCGFTWDDAQALGVRGRCIVAVSVGDRSHRFEATISPSFTGSEDLRLTTGRERIDHTFAHAATAGAAGLDRAVVTALTVPGSEVTVEIRPTGVPAVGALFVVGVPIGNLDDLGLRARRVLSAVDVVLAEDTRRLRSLARDTGVSLPTWRSHHQFNEDGMIDGLVGRLLGGARIALVSDAGTPAVSDPGQVLARAAHEAGVGVHPVAGPSAVTAALSVAGLPATTATFAGFPPRKPSARRARLAELGELPGTVVLFESPHRIAGALEDIAAVLPGRDFVLANDLTKHYETVSLGRTGTAPDLIVGKALGEYTIVIGPAPHVEDDPTDDLDPIAVKLVEALADAVPSRVLADAVAAATGCSRRRAYDLVLGMRDRDEPSGA